jgi:hypothetical protein
MFRPSFRAPLAVAVSLFGLGLITPGTLTVGSDIPYAPFEFNDRAAGDQLTGFDVELGEALGQKLGLKFDWQQTSFDQLKRDVARPITQGPAGRPRWVVRWSSTGRPTGRPCCPR